MPLLRGHVELWLCDDLRLVMHNICTCNMLYHKWPFVNDLTAVNIFTFFVSTPHQGFVATLKDSFGFIESEEHDCELFFPFT